MVESRDRPEEKVGLPRTLLAWMISSKSRMAGVVPGCVSRSWMNSLNAGERGQPTELHTGFLRM